MRSCWAVALLLAVQTVSGYASAQTPVPPASPSEPYVLHVYANLIQVPMLALSANYGSLPPLTSSSVNISLESGPVFHPTKMHIQGEEPISLAIVLDASGNQDHLLHTFAESAEAMSAASLLPHDHLTLFAVDCKIIRSSLNVPIGPGNLRTAVDHALAAQNLHGGKTRGACGKSLHLWDTTAIALKSLTSQSGRRMLLLVSDGEDRKSTFSWNAVRNFADDNSIAIFGLRDLDRFAGDVGPQFRYENAGVYYNSSSRHEDFYREICEATGGLILTTPAKQLTISLERIIAMMRGRYILEFPRATNSTPGRHSIDVTIPERRAYIATAGVTVPMPDASTEKDPTTVPSAPSPAVMGTRRVLPETH